MKDHSNFIAIIGAGISGLALGIILQRNKIPCIIFEKSEKISEYGAGISISPNGLAVLNNLDVINDLKPLSRQPEQAIFFSNNKKINQIPINVFTTTRKSIYKVLLDKYQELKGEIYFGHEVVDVDNETKMLTFNDKKSTYVKHIIACDGIKSICQKKVSSMYDEPKYSGYYVWRTIFPSNQTNIHFYLGSNFHVVSYPVDKERSSLVAAVKSKNKQNESWKQQGSIHNLLSEIPSNILKNYPSISENYGVYKWGIFLRPNVKSLFDNNITYVGDAAHPIVPFIGQGACLALEDSYVLGQLISKHNNIKIAQAKYNKLRINRVRTIYRKSLNQGKLNHLRNPLLVFLRNFLMKYTNIISTQTKSIWLYDVTNKKDL
jgi:salicylate hydroxylase|tara:strand:+ start:858 stop:1985 length:1128 start_codon:yes stop_codon:yes gene_type:complete